MIVILGASLAGGLLARRLSSVHPELALQVFDQDREPRSQTWSFHETDVDPSDLAWMRPLCSAAWPRHEVAFPGGRRQMRGGYFSIRADVFRQGLADVLGDRLRVPARVVRAGAHEIELDSGEVIPARLVIDARGEVPNTLPKGYQKFLGFDVELAAPHGLTQPLIMDARVPQRDGFRFIYVLPWDERRCLIEDTRYSDRPELDRAQMEAEIRSYAQSRGWEIRRVERVEAAALPIPCAQPREWRGARERWASGEALPLGMRAGLFHPVTGYSALWAIRAASRLGALPADAPPAAWVEVVETLQLQQRRSAPYFLRLNQMLFRAARPESRLRVFTRFYGLSEGLIERFYGDRMHWGDRARILVGRPPVPIRSALGALRGGVHV